MPKTKPTKTESLRIEFQNSEREQIDKIATSIAFKNYMSPLVEIAKDNTLFYFVLVPILVSLASLIGLSWAYVGRDDINTAKDLLDDFTTTYQIARDNGLVPAIATTLAATFGSGIIQNIAQDNPEEFAEVLDSIDLIDIATDPGTYINPLIDAVTTAIPGQVDDDLISFVGRLFDGTPNNLW
jgi:hypothetical protein|tara:strand:+ start:76 stop:624 length:549 start_codon:yes stop_codon:yes gene_type:complete